MHRSEPAISKRRQTVMTLTLALAAGLASLGTSIANIALPTLEVAFSAPFSQVQGVVIAYLGALTVSVLIAGRLGDRFNLKRMLMVGLALFLGASLLCSVAPNLWVLIGARAIQGVGAAFMVTLSMALMRQTAGEAGLGRAMGLLGTVSAVGTALGPSLGGLLIPLFGWRATFLVQVPFAVAALLLAFLTLPSNTNKETRRLPSLLSVLNRQIAPMLAVNLLVAAVMMTTLVVGPFYLGVGLGLDATSVGLIMTIGPAIAIVSGVPSGRLVDRWGSDLVLAIGILLLASGAFLLALLPNMIGVVGYVVAMIILTPGYQLFQAANNTAAMAEMPRESRGTASGFLNLSRNIGLIGGTAILGAVFAHGVGTGDLSRAGPLAIAAGMRLTFLVAGATMVLVIAISLGTAVLRRASR